MRALIRKEAIEVSLYATIFAALVLFAWFAFGSVEEDLLAPKPGAFVVTTLLGTFGAIGLGFGVHAAERSRRTEVYLLHRSAARRVFAVKTLVGALAAYLVLAGPFAVWLAFELSSSPLRPVVQTARIVEGFAFATTAVTGFALGTLGASLRRHPVLDVAFALSAAFAVSQGTAWVAPHLAGLNVATAWVLVQLVVTGLVLALALALARARRDRDFPLTPSLGVAAAAAALPLLVLPALCVLQPIQLTARELLARAHPSIVLTTPGDEIHLARRIDALGPSRYQPVDADGEVLSEAWGPGAALLLYQPGREIRVRPLGTVFGAREMNVRIAGWWPLGERQWRHGSRSFRTNLWFDPRAGIVRGFCLPGERYHGGRGAEWPIDTAPPAVPSALELARGDGRSFSSNTVVVDSHQSVGRLLVDRDDGTLWSADPRATGGLERVELPEGDRFVSTDARYDRGLLRLGVFVPIGGAVRGERGTYVWDDDELRAVGPDDGALLDQHGAVQELAIELVDPDPLNPTAEVRDVATGDVILAHRFRPAGVGQIVASGVLYACALLRPPAVSVASFFESSDGRRLDDASLEGQPLFRDGRRIALLALQLLLVVAAELWILARLRRRAAPVGVVATWLVVVAVGGLLAAPAFRYLEGRAARARRRDAHPDPGTVVLIRTV